MNAERLERDKFVEEDRTHDGREIDDLMVYRYSARSYRRTFRHTVIHTLLRFDLDLDISSR